MTSVLKLGDVNTLAKEAKIE